MHVNTVLFDSAGTWCVVLKGVDVHPPDLHRHLVIDELQTLD